MTASTVEILRRENVDGSWSSLATCPEHHGWNPGWCDPADFGDDPRTADQLAYEHALGQGEDHTADQH